MNSTTKTAIFISSLGLATFLTMAFLTGVDHSKQDEAIVDYVSANRQNTLIKNVQTLRESEQLFNYGSNSYDYGTNPFKLPLNADVDSVGNGEYEVIVTPMYTHSIYNYPINPERYMGSTPFGNLQEYLLRFHIKDENEIVRLDAIGVFADSLNNLHKIVLEEGQIDFKDYLLNDKINVQRTIVEESKAEKQKKAEQERLLRDGSKNAHEDWYKGGTLHKATVQTWENASDRNKLATCADFVATIKKKTGGSYENMEQMYVDAFELKSCIDEAIKGEEIRKMDISGVAASCAIVLEFMK